MNTYLVQYVYGSEAAEFKPIAMSAQAAVDQLRADASRPVEVISVHLLVDMDKEWK